MTIDSFQSHQGQIVRCTRHYIESTIAGGERKTDIRTFERLSTPEAHQLIEDLTSNNILGDEMGECDAQLSMFTLA